MSNYVIVSSDILIEKDQLTNSAVLLWKDESTLDESKQYALRISSDNAETFRHYIKYDESAILNARENQSVLDEIIPTTVQNRQEPFSTKQLRSGQSLFKRVHGSEYTLVTAGSSSIIQFEIPYSWVKIEAMEIIGAGAAHSVDLSILDSVTNDYSGVPVEVVGPNLQLNQYAFNVNISEGFHRFYSKYDADLYQSMVVQVVVYNSSSSESRVGVNFELNEVR